MMKNWLVFLFLICSAVALSQKSDAYKVAQQIEDFTIFKTTLEECHSGLYTYASKQTIDSLFNGLKQVVSAKPLSEFELLAYYSKVVTAIQCIHSGVGLKNQNDLFSDWLYLSGHFRYQNNQLFCKKEIFFEGFHIFEGDEVLAINGGSIEVTKKQLFQYISSDGANTTFKERMLRGLFFYFFKLDNPNSKQIELLYVHNDDTLLGVLEDVARFGAERVVTKAKNKSIKQQKLITSIDTVNSLGTLRLKSPMPIGKKHQKQLAAFFDELAVHNINHLIIDVRDNLGGKPQGDLLEYLIDDWIYTDERVTTPIKNATYKKHFVKRFSFQYILSRYTSYLNNSIIEIKPKENQFKGAVYVLINGYTVSAASNLASMLKERSNALLLGEETGGGYKGWNTGGVVLKLPHAKLYVSVPNIKGENNTVNEYTTSGVTPHIPLSDNQFEVFMEDEEKWVEFLKETKKNSLPK